MLLGRDDVFKARDLKVKDVPVPEWGEGGVIRIQSWMGFQRNEVEKDWVGGQKVDFKEKMIITSAIDKEGKPLFTMADVKALSKKSAIPLDRIANAVLELNGLLGTDVEDAIKN
jgi:hypothetical protein